MKTIVNQTTQGNRRKERKRNRGEQINTNKHNNSVRSTMQSPSKTKGDKDNVSLGLTVIAVVAVMLVIYTLLPTRPTGKQETRRRTKYIMKVAIVEKNCRAEKIIFHLLDYCF